MPRFAASFLRIFRVGLLSLTALALGWFGVSYFFDEDNITHLAGLYYTASSGNGAALHLYENVAQPSNDPLLEQVYETQVTTGLLVARAGADVYFVYPLRARSLSEATAQRRGPYSKQELFQTLLQLSGDTTLHAVGPF